jgi:Zn-dependent protease
VSSWQYSPGTSPYAYARPQVHPTRRFSTSSTEITHIVIAAIVLAVDFAIIRARFNSLTGNFPQLSYQFLIALAFGATAALTAFVFHELAHKFVAQSRGFWAEFRASPSGLVISLITALIGFLFAAPGATVVSGMNDRRDWGVTSLAGPLTNLFEGGAFMGAALVLFRFAPGSTLFLNLAFLAFFNGWFATFNLIPFGPLDGRKVLSWSAPTWVVSFVVSATLSLFAFAVYSNLLIL